MISTEQLRAMIDNAAKATPGPYSFVPWHIAEGNPQVRVGRDLLCELSSDHTAQHIAACDPQTITAMAEEILAGRAELERLREKKLTVPLDGMASNLLERAKLWREVADSLHPNATNDKRMHVMFAQDVESIVADHLASPANTLMSSEGDWTVHDCPHCGHCVAYSRKAASSKAAYRDLNAELLAAREKIAELRDAIRPLIHYTNELMGIACDQCGSDVLKAAIDATVNANQLLDQGNG